MLHNISLPYTPAPRQQALVPVRQPNTNRFGHGRGYRMSQEGVAGKVFSAVAIVAVTAGLCAFIALHEPTLSVPSEPVAVASVEVPAVPVETVRPRTAEVAAPLAQPVAQPAVSLPAVNTPALTGEAPVVSTQGDGPIRIRLGPGTGYSAIGKLNDGEDATVIGHSVDNYWWKISYQGQTGWISSAFVKFSGDPSSVPLISDQPLLYSAQTN